MDITQLQISRDNCVRYSLIILWIWNCCIFPIRLKYFYELSKLEVQTMLVCTQEVTYWYVVRLNWVRNIPYTAKHLWGKTFAFRVENNYSLENFLVSMLILPINKVRICGKRFTIEWISVYHESFPPWILGCIYGSMERICRGVIGFWALKPQHF